MILDWADWQYSLERFSRATGLSVSCYDEKGVRRVGPLHDAGVAPLLAASGVWRDASDGRTGMAEAQPGAGDVIEAELVAGVLAAGAPAQCHVAGEMTVICAPIIIGGAVRGALVYGWVFETFGTPLGCQRLARELGVDATRLWSAVRLTPPVPPARLVVFTELLQTMVAAAARHAEAMERLDAMGRLREVFLARVSHELRTPLSALGLRIEALIRGADMPEKALTSLEKMKQHVAQQARLVDDLLEASRTRTGHMTLDRRTTSLNDVLTQALAATIPHAETKGITVVVSGLEQAAGRDVLADPHRLQQVFWNLLSNAVKFTPSGGRVSLQVESNDLAHEVLVADTGRGIEAAVLPEIFEPFHKSRDDNEVGLGLGLSIARYIVEGHGGALVAHSEGAGAGAQFRVRIPVTGRGSAGGLASPDVTDHQIDQHRPQAT